MQISYTVYMDQRDVTRWIDDIEIIQDRRTLYRQARLAFRGWFPLDPASTWDIYGTTDPAVPRSSLLLRRGVIPPDQPAEVLLSPAGVKNVVVTVYDWVWVAQRMTPLATVVAAPTPDAAMKALVVADREAWPVGKWQYLPARTMHAAVAGLAAMAGLTVEIRIPDYPIAATVFDPRQSIWDLIWSLVEPLRPDVYFRRERDAVVFADSIDVHLGIGGRLALSDESVLRASFHPQMFRHLRRVVVRFPAWR